MPKTLNVKQVQVLEWIKNGCPDGVFDRGYEHRISARVLERRGLVKITGSGDTWRAELTKAGREWKMENQEGASSSPEVIGLSTGKRGGAVVAAERDSGEVEEPPAEASEEEQLLKRVIDDGSVLLPEDPTAVKR